MLRPLLCKLGWHTGWREVDWHFNGNIEAVCWICGKRRVTVYMPKTESRVRW
jgi:hypothetical protein